MIHFTDASLFIYMSEYIEPVWKFPSIKICQGLSVDPSVDYLLVQLSVYKLKTQSGNKIEDAFLVRGGLGCGRGVGPPLPTCP